ncbi:MAG: RNA polymerase subunit sigma-24 [Myxococcales bacterium]|nr:RNA polymerase subunit sigma-24 [Myxococcales bacterium]
MSSTAAEIARTFRDGAGRATATLARSFGDLDLAEEMVQEAFAVALERWPSSGIPPSPVGWIVTTARNRAIDRVRRESTRDERQRESVRLHGRDALEPDSDPDAAPDAPMDPAAVLDDQLRLVFTCCHPALALPTRVALTLRLVGGLQTAEIARAFLVPEPTMAQRLVRAKHKIRAAGIPYRVPAIDELPERLQGVLAVLYLVFNEGYVASSGDAVGREDLARESIRLTRGLVECLPNEPEVQGLLALQLLTESRRAARVADDGALVLLRDQDRGRWDRVLVAEGQSIVRACLRRNAPGPYQIQAAIAAVHADAERAQDTDWSQIVALYDHLLAIAPTPIVALNRAIAVGELGDPAAALALLDGLALDSYHLYHAARADLLARLGRIDGALAALAQAIALTQNGAELRLLHARREGLRGGASNGRAQAHEPG